MKEKIKKELPEYGDGVNTDAVDDLAESAKKHGKFDGKSGIQTASDFLKKYKNRGAVMV